jgi:hypothetical protein
MTERYRAYVKIGDGGIGPRTSTQPAGSGSRGVRGVARGGCLLGDGRDAAGGRVTIVNIFRAWRVILLRITGQSARFLPG